MIGYALTLLLRNSSSPIMRNDIINEMKIMYLDVQLDISAHLSKLPNSRNKPAIYTVKCVNYGLEL